MNYDEAFKKLSETQQIHILDHFYTLSETQKKKLLHQIELIPLNFLNDLEHSKSNNKKNFSPVTNFELLSDCSYFKEGEKKLFQGKMGCLILAGGQGTRLGHIGPKGTYPISLIKKKSLFQIFLEKAKAASNKYHVDLHLAIMTSQQNHSQTVSYLKENQYFGLKEEQVELFTQEDLPLFDLNHKLFLTKIDEIATGPDGNGKALQLFYKTQIWHKWKSLGIDFVNVVLIDNPLANPFDSEFLGFTYKNKLDVGIKACFRNDPKENVGLLVQENDHIKVAEYNEIDPNEKGKLTQDGQLLYPIANLGLFIFSMSFIKNQADVKFDYHTINRTYSSLCYDDQKVKEETVEAKKYETYIFDLLKNTKNSKVIVYPRNLCFSPLKNAKGESSITTVQKDLLLLDQRTYARISGMPISKTTFELSQEFYYPMEKTYSTWGGQRPIEGIYIS